jgi:hypothetical protein
MGTSIRGDAAECDLLILIREQGAGSFVDVNCSAKSQVSPASPGKTVDIIGTAPSKTRIAEEMKESHVRRVAELGIHPTYHDAPAPPLVWPSWLVHIKGAEVRPQQGVDESRKPCLKARYISSLPMTTVYNFYEDLLNRTSIACTPLAFPQGKPFPESCKMPGGMSKAPTIRMERSGPRTVIHVSFSRSKLNDPITVEMRFTVYEFVAPKGRPFRFLRCDASNRSCSWRVSRVER